MVNCCIIGCTKRSVRDRGIRFFRIPKVIENHCPKTKELSEQRRHLWLCRINRVDLKLKSLDCLRVCCLHFIKGQPSSLFDHGNLDWAPSLLLSNSKKTVSSDSAIKCPVHKCRTVNDNLHQSEEYAPHGVEQGTIDRSALTKHETDIVSKRGPTRIDICPHEKDCQALQTETFNTKMQMLHSMPVKFSAELLRDNDVKVQFYTGLPTFSILKTLYNFLHKEMQIRLNYATHALTPFEELLIVLMRLRLNMQMEDLAYQFRVSEPTASKIFSTWITIMHTCLEDLIQWPSWLSTMPKIFKEVFSTSNNVVIIDCFEVFIEQPSSFHAWASTWSRDKHNSTVKYLIGVTPQGTVCYLSMGWSGRTSDKYIIDHSGFLDKMQPGDVVLADRSFDIVESLASARAKLLVPSVIKEIPQLSTTDGQNDRRRAELRSHVQRAIKIVREKYVILNGIIPIDCLSTKPSAQLDQICRVCCMLTNMCLPVAPLS